MSKTINRMRAFIYDVHAKCESNAKFSIISLIKHHRIGSMGYEAFRRMNRVIMTKPYKWIGDRPDERFVQEVESIRENIQKVHIEKYSKSDEIEIPSNELQLNAEKFNVDDLSELSQIEIIKNALNGKNVAYITPTYKLAKTFFDKLSKAVPFESNRSDLFIKFPNGGSVEFFTGERLDNLRGRKFHLAVIEQNQKLIHLIQKLQTTKK